MARYISDDAPRGWRPRPGELITGRSGKREFTGRYLRTRQVGWGCVLAFIATPDGHERGVNEIKPAEATHELETVVRGLCRFGRGG